MTERIEAQIERFAPGFRDRIMAKSTMDTVDMEHSNANYIGGDIYGGLQDFRQLFTRPVVRLTPYSTPAKGLYLRTAPLRIIDPSLEGSYEPRRSRW